VGGLINMSYGLDATIHNTQWVTAHFHLIYAGAIVIMYFAIAYELWPKLAGRPLFSVRLARWQLWLWFIGLMVTTIPWHLVGLMGQPRRMAFYDYHNPAIAPQAPIRTRGQSTRTNPKGLERLRLLERPAVYFNYSELRASLDSICFS
jgi:heme/copper-type cytochrome/quinol oxidase subunit 1